MSLFIFITTTLAVSAAYFINFFRKSFFCHPLRNVAGPPIEKLLSSQLQPVLECANYPFFCYYHPLLICRIVLRLPPGYMSCMYRDMVAQYGYKELGPSVPSFFSVSQRYWWLWSQLDQRLLTLDPLSVAYVLKNSTIFEKPWQSRRMITSLIGCGMLAAEGHVHKRQRRVGTPAFSVQNLRALVPLVFQKGNQLKERWLQLAQESPFTDHLTLDVCHWISRATLDVIGVAGLLYNFDLNQFLC